VRGERSIVDSGHFRKKRFAMRFNARKKFGPFNVSWSPKKGWNVSAGAGGLRVGANKKGSYLSANKSVLGLRYSRRSALGTPQALGTRQRTHDALRIFWIVVAVCGTGLLAFAMLH
jgi:hypothetical protein